VQFRGSSSVSYVLRLESGTFPGAVDSQGYPIFQPFELNTFASLSSIPNVVDGVGGPATVNASP
jgi:hypothetical protein